MSSTASGPAQAGPAPAAPVPVKDERLANISATARILRRPEIGALLAAVVIAIFFWTQNHLFLKLYKENLNTVGGGQPVLTGPGFVDKSNAAGVAKLAEAGTR